MSMNLIIIINIMLLCHFVDAQRSSPCHRKCKYVEAFQQANCNNRSLHAVPIECNAASYLSLRYNHITTIEPGLFKGFPFLKYLILSNNEISRVEANTFVGAPQLKSIKLLYNNLQVLDRNALNGTKNRLRNIDFSNNALNVIENGTFQAVPRLEVIDLYGNRLNKLSSGVFEDLDHLKRLSLSMNELVDLPENIFKDLTALVYLDLSNNSLSSLSLDLFVHMNHLKTIDLSGNKLVDIGNVLTLSNILLDLRWNHLSQLGDVSLEFLNSNVEVLYLEGNPWNCTCSVEPLRLWYQQLSVSNEKGVKVDNPFCSFPFQIVNRKINSLNVSLCMPSKSKETSMNLPVYRPTVITSTDPLYSHVTESSEKSTANSQMKVIIIIIVIIAVAIVIIAIVIYIVIRVLLLKKRSKDSDKNIDCERNEQEVSAVILEDGGNNIVHTPLNAKPDLEVRKRSPFGIDLTPKHEIMKEEGSSPLLHKMPRGTPTGETSREDSNRRTKKTLIPKGCNQDGDELGVEVLKWD